MNRGGIITNMYEIVQFVDKAKRDFLLKSDYVKINEEEVSELYSEEVSEMWNAITFEDKCVEFSNFL